MNILFIIHALLCEKKERVSKALFNILTFKILKLVLL